MHTFGELTTVDPRTLRPLVGVARVTGADGQPVSTYDTFGQPAPVVASMRGYVGQFRADESHTFLWLELPGGPPHRVTAHEAVDKAGEAVEVITSGRLSEASLTGTIDTRVDEALADYDPGTGTIREDPNNPGLYIFGDSSGLVEDPTTSGLYLIGA